MYQAYMHNIYNISGDTFMTSFMLEELIFIL